MQNLVISHFLFPLFFLNRNVVFIFVLNGKVDRRLSTLSIVYMHTHTLTSRCDHTGYGRRELAQGCHGPGRAWTCPILLIILSPQEGCARHVAHILPQTVFPFTRIWFQSLLHTWCGLQITLQES